MLIGFSSFSLPSFAVLGSFLPLDSLFSTQGVMVMLLVAYAGAMWMFLSSAPKVYTVMVSDLDAARRFYQGELKLSLADVPLHYYYNYEQTLGLATVDPLYVPAMGQAMNQKLSPSEGLWYQLKKNVQLHVISGASFGEKDRQRHVCFDRDCLEQLLFIVQNRHIKYKIRQERPLNFLVKDYEGRVIEIAEVSN
jgi:catechol 2,3-dioxygenase-like lactoylglutathione lyase family enzyme